MILRGKRRQSWLDALFAIPTTWPKNLFATRTTGLPPSSFSVLCELLPTIHRLGELAKAHLGKERPDLPMDEENNVEPYFSKTGLFLLMALFLALTDN